VPPRWCFPSLAPSPDTGGRKLRLLMTRWRMSLSVTAAGAKSLAAGRAVGCCSANGTRAMPCSRI